MRLENTTVAIDQSPMRAQLLDLIALGTAITDVISPNLRNSYANVAKPDTDCERCCMVKIHAKVTDRYRKILIDSNQVQHKRHATKCWNRTYSIAHGWSRLATTRCDVHLRSGAETTVWAFRTAGKSLLFTRLKHQHAREVAAEGTVQ